jgi:hypothetical protein
VTDTALIIIVVTLCLTFVVWACLRSTARPRGCRPPSELTGITITIDTPDGELSHKWEAPKPPETDKQHN